MRVLVGTAAYRITYPATTHSMCQLAKHGATECEIVDVIVEPGYGAPRNLERILQRGLDTVGEGGYVLYHDSDVVYSRESVDAIARLSRHLHDATSWPDGTVVAAQYFASFGRDHLGRRVLVGTPDGPLVRPAPGLPHCAPAVRMGFGFALIPLTVLKLMSKPWIRETWDGYEQITPDTIFCERINRTATARVVLAVIPGVKHPVTNLEEVE